MVGERHNRKGNCWTQGVVFSCKECGKGEMCDVCHAHDEPRGDCLSCPECPVCDKDRSPSP